MMYEQMSLELMRQEMLLGMLEKQMMDSRLKYGQAYYII